MWFHQNKPVISVDQFQNHIDLVGFVYKITNLTTGQFYIGKKNFFSKLKKKLTQKEIAALPDKRFKHHKYVTKESDWKSYFGSNIDLKNDVKVLGAESFQCEMLEVCYTKKYLSFAELEQQIKHDVLRNKSYNSNILGKFFSRDMENTPS